MCLYLDNEELVFLNEIALKITHEEFRPEAIRYDDIDFILNSIIELYAKNLYRKATAYCVYIICLHPFSNGNHRTSILAAEHFLLKNDYTSCTTPQSDLALEKFRLSYEEKHELEQDFFRIANIESCVLKQSMIETLILSHYGWTIENWLQNNYKKRV